MILKILLFSSLSFTQEYVPGEVIVKLKDGLSFTASESFRSKASNQKSMTLRGSWKSLNMYHYRTKPGASVQQIISELSLDPAVEYAEPNYIVHKKDIVSARGEAISEAEFFQMMEAQSGSFNQTSAPIEVENAWSNLSDNSNRPIVAIIDTGIDYTHPAFTRWCAMWVNSAEKNGLSGVDDDGNGYIDDIYGYNFVSNNGNPFDDDGHGSHVAGIVYGTTQDLTAIPDVMPVDGECDSGYLSRIRLMAVKFLDHNGSGTTSDAIKSIYYAVNNGAKILNNSWGGGSYSAALHDAIAYAYSNQTSFIAAAGNSGSNNDSFPMYPANYDAPNVISVASSMSNDNLSFFSNYGAGTVHLASPGNSVYSTLPGGFYSFMSGTSMAAPFVAGVAALIAREKPGMNGYQIKEIINNSANPKSHLSSKLITSARLNVNNSVLSAQGATINTSQPSYTVNYSTKGPASQKGGCGMVTTLSSHKGNMPDKSLPMMMMILSILLLPLLVIFFRKAENRRQFERLEVHSSMKIKVGDHEVIGSMESLSLGGASVDVNELMEKGSVLTIKIQTPDGEEEVEVKGRVVWCDGKSKHGIQFLEQREGVLALLKRYMGKLAV